MSLLVPTRHLTRREVGDRSQRVTTASSSARHMEVIRASRALRLPADACRTRSFIREWCGTRTLIQKAWLNSGNIRSQLVAEQLSQCPTVRMGKRLGDH